jgi:hypothetical protein
MSDAPLQYYADVDANGVQRGFYTNTEHATLPPTAVPITVDQWQSWITNQNHRLVNGTLVAPPTPPLTPDQILAEKIAAGIAITSTVNSALNDTFALDDTTLTQIGSVARDAASGLGLPLGIPVFVYPNIAGEPCTFTSAQIIALYKAQRDLLFRLNTQAAIMGHGVTPVWPSQTATID